MDTQNTQQNYSKYRFFDDMENISCKMQFMANAIAYWQIEDAIMSTDDQCGFSLIMDDLIKEMKEKVKKLEK